MDIYKITSIISTSLLVYIYFVYKGAEKKYKLDVINQLFPSKKGLLKTSYDLFKLGINK